MFLVPWIWPSGVSPKLFGYLVFVMTLEGPLTLSAGFIGIALAKEENPEAKHRWILAYILFSTFFIVIVALMFEAGWTIPAFLVLTISRPLPILLSEGETRRQMEKQAGSWIGGFFYYMVCFAVTTLLPIPRLGLRPGDFKMDRQLKGLWVDDPQRLFAFGFLFFTVMGLIALSEGGKETSD